MSREEVAAVLKRAKETLDTAYYGLKLLTSGDPKERSPGLRNVLVFSRSTTFVIQNLRSVVGGDQFDSWYTPHQEQMKSDPVMKYFVEARNNLEKQGRLDVGLNTHIKSFSTPDMRKFGTPPAGAKSFFIGDEIGGTGWEVELANGETEKFYVALPESIGSVSQTFIGMPDTVPEELRSLPVEQLSEMVLGNISAVLDDAFRTFLPGGRSNGPILRLVK